ncbi:MAG: hypothetical protein ABWZ54_11865 [Luteibacter sp.]
MKTSSPQTQAKPSSPRKKAAVRPSGKRVRRQRTMRARGRA